METPEGTPGGGTEYLGGHGAAEQARAGAQVPNDGAPSQQAPRLLQGLQEAQRRAQQRGGAAVAKLASVSVQATLGLGTMV